MPRMPLIVPYGADQTIFQVVEAMGPNGLARESVVERTSLETVITELLSGRFDRPIGIRAFNTLEHWTDDLTGEVAQEIQCRCDIDGRDVPDHLQDFVDGNIKRVRQPCAAPAWK